MKRYLPILKMAEDIFSGPQSDTKHRKLLECILTRNSKLYLGKVYTEEQLKKLSKEEVEKLFNNYEAKLSGQMVKFLGCSIINMYSMGACAVLGITNQDALSEVLENDPFLNSALQRFTCELYYRFSSFLAPLSIGIITIRHYLSECNKNGGTSGDNEGPATAKRGEASRNEQNLMGSRSDSRPSGLSTSSKYKGPMGPHKQSYWIFYRYGYSGFLFWNWTHWVAARPRALRAHASC